MDLHTNTSLLRHRMLVITITTNGHFLCRMDMCGTDISEWTCPKTFRGVPPSIKISSPPHHQYQYFQSSYFTSRACSLSHPLPISTRIHIFLSKHTDMHVNSALHTTGSVFDDTGLCVHSHKKAIAASYSAPTSQLRYSCRSDQYISWIETFLASRPQDSHSFKLFRTLAI